MLRSRQRPTARQRDAEGAPSCGMCGRNVPVDVDGRCQLGHRVRQPEAPAAVAEPLLAGPEASAEVADETWLRDALSSLAGGEDVPALVGAAVGTEPPAEWASTSGWEAPPAAFELGGPAVGLQDLLDWDSFDPLQPDAPSALDVDEAVQPGASATPPSAYQAGAFEATLPLGMLAALGLAPPSEGVEAEGFSEHDEPGPAVWQLDPEHGAGGGSEAGPTTVVPELLSDFDAAAAVVPADAQDLTEAVAMPPSEVGELPPGSAEHEAPAAFRGVELFIVALAVLLAVLGSALMW